MSYDPPTRRLDPQAPVAVRATPEQAAAEEAAWRQEVLDRFGALRTGLILVGLLAAAALALSLYSLLSDEDTSAGDGRRGASPSRVAALERKVDDLDQQVDGRATKASVSEVRSRQEALDARVAKLRGTTDDAADAADVQAVSDELQALEQRVDDLATQQQDPGAAETP